MNPKTVSSPSEIASSIGANNPTLTARALGLALFQFDLAVVAFRDGRCPSTTVDAAYRVVERLTGRVNEIKREAERIAQAAFRESCKPRSRLLMERAIGVKPMQGVRTLGLSRPKEPSPEPLPIVSNGPSGIGGPYQNEFLDESGFSAGAGGAD